MCVYIIFSSGWVGLVWVVEWSSFGKELLTRLTICSLCSLTICSFSYFQFWFSGLDLDSDCFSSWCLHTLYFYKDFKSQNLAANNQTDRRFMFCKTFDSRCLPAPTLGLNTCI